MTSSPLRLSTRLLLAFGLLVLMSALSSAFALWKLSAIEDNLTVVVTDNNVRMKLNQEMSEAVHVVARVMRTIVLLSDADQKALEFKKIGVAREAYDHARTELEHFTAVGEAKALRAALDADAQVARAINNKVIALGMDNRTKEATTLLLSDAREATQRWQDKIELNLALQEKHNAERFEASKADYAAARTTLIAAAVLGAAVAAVLALSVVRSIVRALGGEPADVAALAQAVASSDLTTQISVKQGDSTSVVAAMARMQHALSGIVKGVRGNAESVAAASAQIANGNLDLSSRTEEQASALQQTAASMEQLGATVKQNADNARQANQLALGASEVALKGGAVVAQVVDTMKGITDSSNRIVDIIAVIDSIAFQTNILALNAAVEAARAGEQGRGFAVVASEVRSLAQRSAAAAKEIKSLITESVQRVGEGTALVDSAGATMNEVVASIRRVTDIVGEISAASAEQATGVAQVGDAVAQMDQATQQNSALVEQSAAAAASLKEQADALVGAVAVFRLGSAPTTRTAATPAARFAEAPRMQASRPAARPQPARLSNAERSVIKEWRKPVDPPKTSIVKVAVADGASSQWESF